VRNNESSDTRIITNVLSVKQKQGGRGLPVSRSSLIEFAAKSFYEIQLHTSAKSNVTRL
jgi:hypothetical protein